MTYIGTKITHIGTKITHIGTQIIRYYNEISVAKTTHFLINGFISTILLLDNQWFSKS